MAVTTGGRDPLSVLIDREDGGHFAAIATDPLGSHPLRWFPTIAEAAYRYARPGMGLLGWVASLGQSRFVAPALVALTAISVGVLALASGRLARALGADPGMAAIAAALLPGTLLVIVAPGMSDGFATGFALFGLTAWVDRRPGRASAWWVAAALFRETTLVFPLAALLTGRRDRRLLAPFAAYGLWAGAVRIRLGAWPTAAGNTRLSLPWDGIPLGMRGWSQRFGPGYVNAPASLHVAVLAITVILICAALVVGRDVARTTVAVAAVASLFMGRAVWFSAAFFGRVLLPATAVAVTVILTRTGGSSPSPELVVGSSDPWSRWWGDRYPRSHAAGRVETTTAGRADGVTHDGLGRAGRYDGAGVGDRG